MPLTNKDKLRICPTPNVAKTKPKPFHYKMPPHSKNSSLFLLRKPSRTMLS